MAAPLPDLLQRAEEALHDGRVQEARLLLVEFIKSNPRSERAWWLLSFAVTDEDQQIDCLKRVLHFNLDHAEARARLAKLQKADGPQAGPAVSPFILTPESEEAAHELPELPSAPVPALKPTWPTAQEDMSELLPEHPAEPGASLAQPPAGSPDQAPAAGQEPVPKPAPPSKGRRSWVLADLFMGLLVLGGIAFIGYFLWSRQNSTSTQQAAQQTQAMAQALTGLPVSTQLPTWTWTPSPSPSATPTPSGTATITLTPEDTPTETPIPASQIGPEVRLFAPDFTLTDSVSGQDVSLSQFRGQPILLYFWNTNCLDCLVEISDLNDVYAQYERRGLVLLAIASGDSLTEVNQYRISRGITFPTLLDPNRTITSLYEAFSMPVHFFIGPNGRIATIAKGRIDKIELQRQVSLIVLALPTATPTP